RTLRLDTKGKVLRQGSNELDSTYSTEGSLPVILSEAKDLSRPPSRALMAVGRGSVILSEAKDLSRPANRSFASLRMTSLLSKCLCGGKRPFELQTNNHRGEIHMATTADASKD